MCSCGFTSPVRAVMPLVLKQRDLASGCPELRYTGHWLCSGRGGMFLYLQATEMGHCWEKRPSLKKLINQIKYKTKNPNIHLSGDKLPTSSLSKYWKEKAARVQGPNKRGRKTREIALQNSNQKTRLVAFSNKLANCNEMAVLKGVTSSSFFHHRGYSSLACATLESFYCFCFYYLKC